jgi:hypothetical protein
MLKLQPKAVPHRWDLFLTEQPIPAAVAHLERPVGFFKGMWRHIPGAAQSALTSVPPVDPAASR